jgi:hypothetical protein
MIRYRLLSLPEEIMPAKELLPLQLSALNISAKTPHNT